ncbi:MAG: S8 family peptidase [Thermoanaerobaculia bacterium]|nr:S8 family peptidase [Thermoanaerobaculia bacterium]
MPETPRPLLVLPKAAVSAAPSPRPPVARSNGYTFPKKERRVEILTPRFSALEAAVEQERITIQLTPDAPVPERVLVLEFERPTEKAIQALRQVAGFEELLEEDLAVDADSDFFTAGKPGQKVRVRLYAVMSSQAALEQLLSLWKRWSSDKQLRGHPNWSELFGHLKEVRLWGAADRLRNTGLSEDWKVRQEASSEDMPVEVEIWPRQDGASAAHAMARVQEAVATAGGKVLKDVRIPEIRYHAVLAQLPVSNVRKLIEADGVALVSIDEVRLLKPVPQFGASRNTAVEAPQATCPSSVVRPGGPLGAPVVALLDGLPMEGHDALRDRLVVDDPDSWAAEYESRDRQHGTAMASIILWDDMNEPASPLPSALYVRPVLRPHEHLKVEQAPDGELWVDLLHRAIRRIVEGEGTEPASAPTVRVVNLSLGNLYEPFDREVSPLGRLLDWLAWKYNLLFVVSAGNASEPLTVQVVPPEPREAGVMRALVASQNDRRLLAPADSINALTVGAADSDAGGAFTPRFPEEQMLTETEGLPAPYSRLGRGFRRAVKPEVLLPAGRVLYRPAVSGPQGAFEVVRRRGQPPGILHAAPSETVGETRRALWDFGTSNASARASRLAGLLLPIVSEMRMSSRGDDLDGVPDAVILKALLVHGARWSDDAFAITRQALVSAGHADQGLRDSASAFLGHGVVEPDRIEACTRDRVTLVGGGRARMNTIQQHAVQLPDALNAYVGFRRVTVTLAWFSPISPNNRRYRGVALSLRDIDGLRSNFHVEATDVDGRALGRGTVHHVVLERHRGAIQLPADGRLVLAVECRGDGLADAGDSPVVAPYGLVVSLEVGADIKISVYDEVRELVQARVQVTA